jgi:hypothetical protein
MHLIHRLSIATAVAAAAFAVSTESHAQITGYKNDSVPIAQAKRQLVLPDLTLAPRFDVTFDHFEVTGGAANGASLELGAQLGLLGDIEVEATVISLIVGEAATTPITLIDDAGSFGFRGLQSGADWGVFRLGGTLRFLANDVVEIGGRFRFLIDNNAVIGLNFGLPVRIHLGDIARLDTGIDLHPRFPTSGGDPVFGLLGVDDNALRPSPGIPLDFVVNPIEALWLNIGTGFGVGDVSEDNSIFIPLELGIGGTIAKGDDALVDIGANFAFPALFTPAEDDKAFTNVWQVGLGAKGYIPLK